MQRYSSHTKKYTFLEQAQSLSIQEETVQLGIFDRENKLREISRL